MTMGEVAQLLTAIAAVGSCIASLRNSRKIEAVRHATNSLVDRLVVKTAAASDAEGFKRGQETK
jgi:hypothetical protein